MKKLLFLTFSFFLLLTSAAFGQSEIDTTAATESLKTTVNKVLPGNLNIDGFDVDGNGANCKVSGYVNLAGDTELELSATFTAEADNSSVPVTGTLKNVTIGKLLQAIGISSNDLPSDFTGSTIDSLSMTLDPVDERLTASMVTGLGQMEISGKKSEGDMRYMIGIQPTNLGNMIGNEGINSALSGFTLIYSSHTDEKDSSVDLLSGVKAINGLNLYWTGNLPGPLKDFLALANIPGIDGPKTFVCTQSLTDQISLPTLSYDLGGFKFDPILDFKEIALELNLSDASIGLTGNINSTFGGGLPELEFGSSLVAKMSPLALSGKLSYLGWNNALGIPGVDITELYVGSEASPISTAVSLGGSGNVFGLGATIEVSSTNGALGMSGMLDLIKIESGDITYFSLKGKENEKGAAFELNPSIKQAKFIGKVTLLGIESGSDVIITPSLLSVTTDGSLLGFVDANLTMSAENFTDINNTEFNITGSITQSLTDDIAEIVEQELGSVAKALIGGALSTLSINEVKIDARSTLAHLENSTITLTVDVTLIGFDLPYIPVTLNIKDLKSLPGLVEDIANEVIDELEKLPGELLDELEKVAEEVYLAGKERINWAAGEAKTSAKWMSGAVGPAGEWVEDGVGEIVSVFSVGGSSHSYDCPDVHYTAPSNGDIASEPRPRNVEQYRISLIHIKNIARGGEGNNEHEIWGSIIVKTNMSMQKNANPWLFNKSCRDAIDCAYNNPNTSINHYIDFFSSSDLVATSDFDIEFDLHEEEPNEDDHFQWEWTSIRYKHGEGFPMPPGQETFHTIVLEAPEKDDAENDPLQKIEIKFSIQRIMEPENGADQNQALIGMDNNGRLFAIKTLQSDKNYSPNHNRKMIAVTYMNDGTILGVGTNYKLYTRSAFNADWVAVDNQGEVKSVYQMRDGTILGVGLDHKLYTRKTLNSNWVAVNNSSGTVIAAIELPHNYNGTILGVGTDYRLYTRKSLNSDWKPQNVEDVIQVKAVTQLEDGTIVGLGRDNLLYTRQFLQNDWEPIGNQQGGDLRDIAAKPVPLRVGDYYGGGRVFYLAKSEEDLNGDGYPDLGMVAMSGSISSSKWSEVHRSIPGLDEVGDDIIASKKGLQFGHGASNTKAIVKDFKNSNGEAAKLCADFEHLGFSDWFLPSIGELNLMYNTLGKGTNSGFPDGSYWSSTAKNSVEAWRLRIPNADQWANNKVSTNNRIRPIRVFSTPNCNDGILNQGETAVDCGGPCAPCPTCDDGILNQGETAVDCGGPCAPCPTSCTDGILNQGEISVDCGGPNCAPCPGLYIGGAYAGGIVFKMPEGGRPGLVSSPDLGTGSRYKAHKDCQDYSIDGYSDWRLPTVPELLLMNQNLFKPQLAQFDNSAYWNTKVDESSIYWQDHTAGIVNFNEDDARSSMILLEATWPSYRAVRAFNLCDDGIQNQGETGIDCGGPCAACIAIGDTHEGGIVFYLAKPGEDLNGDGKPDKGLAAAQEDRSAGTNWSMTNTNIPNMQRVVGTAPLSGENLALGRGAINTSTIMQDFSNSGGLAAKLCDDLVMGGFNDWFLPSIGELYLMYTTIGPGAQGPNKNIGNFNGKYWSSSEEAIHGAWRIRFSNGEQWSNNKMTSINKVRAVRVF